MPPEDVLSSIVVSFPVGDAGVMLSGFSVLRGGIHSARGEFLIDPLLAWMRVKETRPVIIQDCKMDYERFTMLAEKVLSMVSEAIPHSIHPAKVRKRGRSNH